MNILSSQKTPYFCVIISGNNYQSKRLNMAWYLTSNAFQIGPAGIFIEHSTSHHCIIYLADWLKIVLMKSMHDPEIGEVINT